MLTTRFHCIRKFDLLFLFSKYFLARSSYIIFGIMPEGPELFLSSQFINRVCQGITFSGKPVRNPIHKCAEINWNEPEYTISAVSRGKELKLLLQSCSTDTKACEKDNLGSLFILFTFGMSGKFEFVAADDLPKHSHLTFFTKQEPKEALVFVDYRRFGKWIEGGHWSADRGPCIIQEHGQFVKNVADNIDNKAFNKPICEVMLDQKFFNGLGNYLRAEILFRCKVAPFEKARTVLQRDPDTMPKVKEETLQNGEAEFQNKSNAVVKRNAKNKYFRNKSANGSIKQEPHESDQVSPDFFDSFTARGQELLKLCGSVPLEVIDIGLKKNSLSEMYDDSSSSSFSAWLQCYYQEGMKNMADHNSRTIWFTGPPGPMVPKEQKVRGKKKAKKAVSEAKVKEEKKVMKESKEKHLKTGSKKKDVSQTPPRLTRKKLKELKQNNTQKNASRRIDQRVRGNSDAQPEKSTGTKRKQNVKCVESKKMKKGKSQANGLQPEQALYSRSNRSTRTIA